MRPIVLAEPVHFEPGSTTLYGAEFSPIEHLDRVMAVLSPRGITLRSLSYTGHSGAGCDPRNGLYEVLELRDSLIPARAPEMPLWGLEDVCYEGSDHWTAPMAALAGTGTQIWNMYSVQGDPDAFEDNLLAGGQPFDCNADLYASCKRHATEPYWSFRTRGAVSHDSNPYFFVREVLPRVFSP
jgi:hypothetical protein